MNTAIRNVVLAAENQRLKAEHTEMKERLNDRLDVIDEIMHQFGSRAYCDPNTPKRYLLEELHKGVDSEKSEEYERGANESGCSCDLDDVYQEGYDDGLEVGRNEGSDD